MQKVYKHLQVLSNKANWCSEQIKLKLKLDAHYSVFENPSYGTFKSFKSKQAKKKKIENDAHSIVQLPRYCASL